MTPSESPGPKIGDRCKQHAIIFHGGRVIVNCVPKFVAMATGVGRGKFKWHRRIAQPKYKGVNANSAQLSLTRTKLYRFELSIGCNAKFCIFWMVAMATVELWRHIRHSYVMVRHMEMKLCLFYSETPYLYLLPIHLWGLKPTIKS